MKIIRESGVKYESYSMGTNVGGECDEVMLLIKSCHEELYQKGFKE
jgi:uncharacterized protein YqgV (UPF0045/DUF77 family)